MTHKWASSLSLFKVCLSKIIIKKIIMKFIKQNVRFSIILVSILFAGNIHAQSLNDVILLRQRSDIQGKWERNNLRNLDLNYYNEDFLHTRITVIPLVDYGEQTHSFPFCTRLFCYLCIRHKG